MRTSFTTHGFPAKQEQHQQLTQILEQHTPVLVFNQDYQIIYSTPACTQLTGYDPDLLCTHNVLHLVHEQDRAHVRATIGSATGSVGIRVVTQNGDETWVRLSWGQIDTTLYYAYLQEITTMREAQERLQQIQQHVWHHDKLAALGRLASDTAHELSNPLTSILGYTELALLHEVSPEVHADLVMIERHAQYACQIAKNLLNFARQREPEDIPMNINDVIVRALELRQKHLQTHNIAVKLQLNPDVPEVVGDPLQLQQVLLNLITNAEQALTEAIWQTHTKRLAQITITSAHIPAQDDEAAVVVVQIQDNGPGVDPDVRRRIFDPFFTTKEQGTGLGLSIAADIIHNHGGDLRVTSTAGYETTMEIRLQAAKLVAREISGDHASTKEERDHSSEVAATQN